MDINACTGAGAGAAQKKLDAAFARAVKRADGQAAKAELVASQNSWVRKRDAACDAEAAEYAGGSMQPSVYSQCIERLTSERVGVLKAAGR